MGTTLRIDKWLWAARFFKTRALAVKACDLGRILANGQRAKPSRDVHVGDLLEVTNEAATFTVEVLTLSDVRGPATVAQTLYRETEASQVERRRLSEERRTMLEAGGVAESRPSKRDRQQLSKLRGRQ